MKQNLLRHSLDTSRNSPYQDFYENKNFKLQINELQTINNMTRERNKILERQISEISQQLANMNKINRKLIGNSGVTDREDFELVYTANYKKQLTDAYKEIEYLKFEVEKLRKINTMLAEENSNLKGRVHQYRKYVVQLSSSQEIEPLASKHVEVSGSLYKSLTDHWKTEDPLSVFDRIYANAQEISQKNTIYICSPNMQKMYSSTLPAAPEKIRIGKMFLLLHSPPKNNTALFSAIEHVQVPRFEKDHLLIPGIIRKDVDFVVQCCEPNRGYFTENDEKAANLLVSFACKELRLLMCKAEEKALKSRLEGVINLMAILVTGNSLDKFANLVDQELGKFFNFESSGIVFVDTISKEFFIFGYSSKPKVKFGNEVIRLPLTMGLTSDCYKSGELKLYQNIKQKAQYSPEIDNVSATGDIRNCIMIGLEGPNEKITGVLQMSNKITGKINAHDCRLIKELSKVLGFLIHGIASIEQALDLTTRMKTSLSTLLLHRN